MVENIKTIFMNFYQQNIADYILSLQEYPIKLVLLIIDITIVVLIAYKALQLLKETRAWQLLK